MKINSKFGMSLVGIGAISHKTEVSSYPDLPSHEPLNPPALKEPRQLDSLFSFSNFDSYFVDNNIPDSVHLESLSAKYLQATLLNLRAKLRRIAMKSPGSARKLGAIARILDEEKQLLELLQMYRAALFQG